MSVGSLCFIQDFFLSQLRTINTSIMKNQLMNHSIHFIFYCQAPGTCLVLTWSYLGLISLLVKTGPGVDTTIKQTTPPHPTLPPTTNFFKAPVLYFAEYVKYHDIITKKMSKVVNIYRSMTMELIACSI